MRFLAAALFLTLITCVVSRKPYDDWVKQIVNSELQNRYSKYPNKDDWVRFIERCFNDNDVFLKIGNENGGIEALKWHTNQHAQKCEAAGKFYSDFKNALNEKFPQNMADVTTHWRQLQDLKAFETYCSDTCHYKNLLNHYVREYSKIIEEENRLNINSVQPGVQQNQNIGNQQSILPETFENSRHHGEINQDAARLENDKQKPNTVQFSTTLPDQSEHLTAEEMQKREEERKQAATTKFYSDLYRSLQEWYPNQEKFQEKLLHISQLEKLHESQQPESIIRYKANFEDNMSSILDLQTYRDDVSKDINARILIKLSRNFYSVELAKQIVARLNLKIEWIFLDDAALEEQTKSAKDTALQAIFDEFMRILGSNLMEWYGTNNQYYWNLINNENLAWELFFGGNDSDTNQESFEGTMKTILNSGAKLPVLVKILKPRIKRILMEKHLDFETYHEHVIYNMEKKAQEKLQAELIFDEAKLQRRVGRAVKNTNKMVRDDFLIKISSSIDDWYPENIEFNTELFKIADKENFYLQPLFNLIRVNKTVFENLIMPILKTPEYEPKVEEELRKRIGSMLVGGYSDMREYEEKVVEKFLLLFGPENRVDLLFNENDFRRKTSTAIIDAKLEIENQAFTKLRRNLNEWLPNSPEFVDKFEQFVRDRRPDLREMKNFDNSNIMLSDENINSERDLVTRTIDNETRAALSAFDFDRVNRNLEYLDLETPYMFNPLTTAAELQRQVRQNLGGIKSCLGSFDNLVERRISEPKELEHLKSNKCIRDEICVETKGNTNQLENLLQPYIDAFRRSKADSEVKRGNIKDEIDETVYDVIEELVKKQDVNKESAECFVKYLRRQGDIDQIYSSSLLFDELELEKAIQPSRTKYQNTYKRHVMKH